MTLKTTPHLNFRGDAREALGFYQSVFGGDVIAATYAELGAPHDPADADKLVWGQVSAGGFQVMAYDVPRQQPWNAGENAFFVSVGGTDPGEISGVWAKLAEGGNIVRPLAPAPWSPLYGMLKDRFGVTWILSVPAAQQAA